MEFKNKELKTLAQTIINNSIQTQVPQEPSPIQKVLDYARQNKKV